MKRKESRLVIENSEIYQHYRERLVNLALAQFSWNNLPETCDRRWLEKSLLFNGQAAFIKPVGMEDWLSVNFIQRGGFDVYGYPLKIYGIGYNAKHIEPEKFEVFYDNMTRKTLLPMIDLYAKLLWEVHNTFRSNLQHQITPYIVASTRNQELSFKNFFNRLLGFDPVITIRNTEDIENSIKVLPLDVKFEGRELIECLQLVWAEALTVLGIAPETTKKERLITDEITINRQEDAISLNARLMNRVDICNKMNKKYGWDISVNLSSTDTELQPFLGNMVTEAIDSTRGGFIHG